MKMANSKLMIIFLAVNHMAAEKLFSKTTNHAELWFIMVE
jgi:hypothetical protein